MRQKLRGEFWVVFGPFRIADHFETVKRWSQDRPIDVTDARFKRQLSVFTVLTMTAVRLTHPFVSSVSLSVSPPKATLCVVIMYLTYRGETILWYFSRGRKIQI